jgi:cysteine desulfuration protein SufE
MRALDDIRDEYEFLDGDDRYRLLIELGRELEPMPEALKTDATLVRGCSASVWVYPVPGDDGSLHFLADSNAAITKGIVALVLAAVQDKPAREVAAMDVA